jgi:methylated-DNA-[protein]-cysteine S-methyltransferase
MNTELKYTVFQSNLGWVKILASPDGLRSLTLSDYSDDDAFQVLSEGLNQAEYSPHFFSDLTKRLNEYFNGKEVIFNDRLDLSGATPFQREVWETTRLIPYGETRSYRWVAEQIKRPLAVRAVGQALSRNPSLIIIPCHRVIASNGNLGGFSSGLEIKKQLLKIEN